MLNILYREYERLRGAGVDDVEISRLLFEMTIHAVDMRAYINLKQT